ncbi:MAG: carboxynorspermidine decarboxylase [Bacteroidaceae bacterium]
MSNSIRSNKKTFEGIPTPCYVMEESKLRANLMLIQSIMEQTGVEIILAFKAFALWKSFPIFREYIHHTTASSPYEARLGFEEFGSKTHTYSPAYEKSTFEEILRCSSHLSFNSFSQYESFYPRVEAWNKLATTADTLSCGIRINPETSEIETELYNPCAAGSRFGVLAKDIPKVLPIGLEGFHCHNHCESDSFALEKTLNVIDEKFGKWLSQLKWLNLGGGHLMTRADYDVNHLIYILQRFKKKYPNLCIILEPGSAFVWQTGVLLAEVIDIVENNKIKTALLNISFTCHMPDCLEMPYMPNVRGAKTIDEDQYKHKKDKSTIYRLGGCSCLSGDYMGYWDFGKSLEIGDHLIFEDMIHYTTVKTNMFNGIAHPSIAILYENGDVNIYRTYDYEDYRNRMC